MKHFSLFSLIFLSAILLSSCKKKQNESSNSPKFNAVAEGIFSDMTNMTDQAIKGNMIYYKNGEVIVNNLADGKPNFTSKSACNVIITLDTLGPNKTITIDWGSTNCECNDGKIRRGKIVTTFTGSYYAQGTVITHTPVDYHVNNHKVEGSKTVTNMGLNGNDQPYYNVVVDGEIYMATGEVINYNSTRVRTFVLGYDTPLNFWDDEYDITLTTIASMIDGDNYTAQTLTPLRIKIGCAYITKGKLEFIPEGKPTRTIDYGNGTCDGSFTIEVNGNTYTIIL
jgi:hypothetical protein